MEETGTKRLKTSHNQPDHKGTGYRDMLFAVGENLTRVQVEQLATLADLSAREKDDIHHHKGNKSLYLFRLLEEKGKLSENDVLWLLSNLAKIRNRVASKVVSNFLSGKERSDNFPSEPESTSSDGVGKGNNFQDFLSEVGLQDKFPGKLTLKMFLAVKDRAEEQNYVECFWQQLTSLDYRAGFSEHLLSNRVSMRDFIFGFLHCSDDFLRQDILEKMSACQLAVPVVLKGINGVPTTFLLWALRRIRKKWKGTYDSLANEHPIVSYPVFTVSVIRIGEVQVSKSQVLNTMMSYSQGNALHSYFLCNEKDVVKPKFSQGCVECAWFLPMCGNEKEIFKEVIAFFNLRGDCQKHMDQTKFLCQFSSLTIAFIASDKRDENVQQIREMKQLSKNILFVSIKGEDNKRQKPNKVHYPKYIDNWLFVKVLQVDVLSRSICDMIVHISSREHKSICSSLETLADVSNMSVDENNNICQKAKRDVLSLFQSSLTEDILQFKQNCFPLQEAWKDLVNIEKQRFDADHEKHESFEHQREHILSAKRVKRELQMLTCLSETMKRYYDIIREGKNNSTSLQYIFGFLQDHVYHMVNTNTKKDLDKILQLESSIRRRQVTVWAVGESEVNTKKKSDSEARTALTHQDMITECSKLYKKCRAKDIGCEHFLRELGQLYEAFKEIGDSKTEPNLKSEEITLLPELAAQLVAEMHSLEIIDGDTGSVPLTWVTSVLDTLTAQLGDPKVIVLSVIGVQSSGKSTFLNSMFGLRFPVRAGRCTSGLFIRFLQIEPRLAEELNCKYLIVVDTEGIRSLDHDDLRFDHKLVTLALGIANVTIFNIEGENISPDMTGVLQIAAHALMRMKEVDLECCCRIVQQRVSDLTAGDRNKANTNRIIETLNEATKFAAEEEGLEGRYEFFADVVDLRVDENLQYIPCLWTGGMSPPNHMYSETVGKIKSQLFGDIRDKNIESNLTLSTFTERIRDVWKAVKEEDFVFNFQDSVRAVDFNQFCLAYNKWVAKMRLHIFVETNQLLQKVEHIAGETNSEQTIGGMKGKLAKKVKEETQHLHSSVEDYMASHPRKKTILKYKKGFLDDMNVVLRDVENHAMTVLTEEYELQKVQSAKNITTFKANWRQRLAIEAKNAATAMTDENEIMLIYEQHWSKWKNMIKEECEQSKVQTNEDSLQNVCEKLLLRITRDMAVGSEIQTLISQEGGIEKHKDLPQECSRYIHTKFVKAWIKHTVLSGEGKVNNQTEEQLIHSKRDEARTFVVEVAHREYSKMKRKQTGKPFDANIYQLMLQNILKELSRKHDNFKPPHVLIAKCLLYISGKSLEWLLDNEKNHRNNYGALLALEKEILFDDFLAFCTQSNHSLRAAEYIYYYLESIYLKKYEAISSSMKCTQDASFQDYGVSPWDALSFVCNKYSSSSRLFNALIGSPLESSYELYVEEKRVEDLSRLRNELSNAAVTLTSGLVAQINTINNLIPFTTFNSTFKSTFNSWCNDLATSHYCPFIKTAGDLYNVDDFTTVSANLAAIINDKLNGTLQNIVFLTDLHVKRNFYCDRVCPMCGTPCDSQLRLHEKHFSFLHRPRGFKGATYANSNKLVLEHCNSSVLSKTSEFTYQERTFLCHKYKDALPEWDIPPSINESGLQFWQWVFVNHNNHMASRYECFPADIPQRWNNITKEIAMHGLMLDKANKTSGRLNTAFVNTSLAGHVNTSLAGHEAAGSSPALPRLPFTDELQALLDTL